MKRFRLWLIRKLCPHDRVKREQNYSACPISHGMTASVSVVERNGKKVMMGKPIHKKLEFNGIKSQHKGLMTRYKKRKLRKRKSR